MLCSEIMTISNALILLSFVLNKSVRLQNRIIRNLWFWLYSYTMVIGNLSWGLPFKKYWSVKALYLCIRLSCARAFQCGPGFGPAAEVLLVWQKDPKPLTPRLASLERRDANEWRADQLASLKQGPLTAARVPSWGQTAGVGPREDEQFRDPDATVRNHVFCMIHTTLNALKINGNMLPVGSQNW